ncbi:GSCFA domain-containing protein [Hansschlegelia sp. KR7-227]|uniref:GSCFA domain-containing protein n=1 Tax=Hansschlegelia sp. KR7-227 TaxID=3400914 RepID=UPI003C0EBBEB
MRLYQSNKSRRDFPGRSDSRFVNGIIFPEFRPKFGIDFQAGMKVFTIGSCFARNIEEALLPLGVNLPTLRFKAPIDEWPYRPNGLLNEYNPGSIAQRIKSAINRTPFDDRSIVKSGTKYADLTLVSGADVTRERAYERRDEIAGIYDDLISSEVVIITLGFVEGWFDKVSQTYLNRMPPMTTAKLDFSRFVFRRMDLYDTVPTLEPVLKQLSDMGKKIVLSISPVPIGNTFSGDDAVVANEFSKAVLRVTAQRLYNQIPNVDYFPSYEIVRSGGSSSFLEDNIHVRNDLVNEITAYMVKTYRAAI